MKTLIITRDKSLFSKQGLAYQELLACSEMIDQLHVIVLTDRRDNLDQNVKLTEKLFLYPTNSASYFLYVRDAYRIFKEQLTSQFNSAVQLVSVDDDYSCAITAYLIHRKYEVNYIINIMKNGLAPSINDGIFTSSIKNSLSSLFFRKAAGIRVQSQTDGEVMYNQNTEFEKKIYILPYPTNAVEKKAIAEAESTIDIHKKYPQFNVIFLMVSKFLDIKTLKRARKIMMYLRSRYSRSGLVILGEVESKAWHWFFLSRLPEYIIIENSMSNKVPYARTANVFIDTSFSHSSGGALAEAAFAGCPIVASDSEETKNIVRDGENGFIADPRNAELFVTKVIQVLETRGFRERIKLGLKYDITEVYGEKVEDYHARLVDIWEKTKTDEENGSKLVSNVVNPITRNYPAFTMDVAKKVQQKVLKEKMVIPQRSEDSIMINVDVMQTGIKEALSEIDLTKNGVNDSDVDHVENVDEALK
jgi:glycosyltransferase involved in cell wall biosynthesis